MSIYVVKYRFPLTYPHYPQFTHKSCEKLIPFSTNQISCDINTFWSLSTLRTGGVDNFVHITCAGNLRGANKLT